MLKRKWSLNKFSWIFFAVDIITKVQKLFSFVRKYNFAGNMKIKKGFLLVLQGFFVEISKTFASLCYLGDAKKIKFQFWKFYFSLSKVFAFLMSFQRDFDNFHKFLESKFVIQWNFTIFGKFYFYIFLMKLKNQLSN